MTSLPRYLLCLYAASSALVDAQPMFEISLSSGNDKSIRPDCDKCNDWYTVIPLNSQDLFSNDILSWPEKCHLSTQCLSGGGQDLVNLPYCKFAENSDLCALFPRSYLSYLVSTWTSNSCSTCTYVLDQGLSILQQLVPQAGTAAVCDAFCSLEQVPKSVRPICTAACGAVTYSAFIKILETVDLSSIDICQKVNMCESNPLSEAEMSLKMLPKIAALGEKFTLTSTIKHPSDVAKLVGTGELKLILTSPNHNEGNSVLLSSRTLVTRPDDESQNSFGKLPEKSEGAHIEILNISENKETGSGSVIQFRVVFDTSVNSSTEDENKIWMPNYKYNVDVKLCEGSCSHAESNSKKQDTDGYVAHYLAVDTQSFEITSEELVVINQ